VAAARSAAALVVLASLAAGSSAGEGTVTAESAHYRLVSTGPQAEADEWARMLEAAWPQYAAFFGKSPPLAKDEKLGVAFFETNDEMQAAIKRAGGTPPSDAGGYYDPVSKTAYAWRQPSVWYTRTLLLHECTHQFHRLARVAPKISPPAWYGEGVAEHVSHHTWDGEHLRLGVVPMLSLEDRPSKALDVLQRNAFALDDALDGKPGAGRPEVMHLVRWLCQGEGGKLRPKFDEIAAKLDRGAKPDVGAFVQAVGPTKKVLASLAAWLPSVQQPWECLYVEWDARGEAALRGSSDSLVALCRRRAPTKHVSAKMKALGTGAWRGGVLLGWTARDDYAIGMVAGGRSARIDVRKDGAWKSGADADVPPSDDGTWTVESVRDGDSVSFVVNGKTVGSVVYASPSMGLAVDASTVDFTDITAQ
jgi:hypothetical protein